MGIRSQKKVEAKLKTMLSWRKFLLGFVAIGLVSGSVFVLSACAGPQGPAGTPGPAGPAGPQGTQGAAGAAGAVQGDGLVSKITSVTIGADRKPVVTFSIADGKGQPLKISDLDTYPRFTIAYIKQDADTTLTSYVNYIVTDAAGAAFKFNGSTVQPALSVAKNRPGLEALPTPAPVFPVLYSNFKDLGNGTYSYTFTTALPEGFDKNVTHVVGGQLTRSSRALTANPVFQFVPAGGDVKVTRAVVTTQSCNQCHDPLAAHGGGARRETSYCVLCHAPQNIDPNSGNLLAFNSYIHKIHRGENLPSVMGGKPFFIGNDTHNFSDVAFPQDIRNCTTCHGAPTAGMTAADYAKLAPNADNWKTAPSRAACGACHDQIDWTTGKSTVATKPDHKGGPQTDDKSCRICHQPDSGKEFDASIVGAHTIPVKSKQLKGFNMTLVGANFKPGQNPTVDFRLTDNASNPISPLSVDSLAIGYAYPTTDYKTQLSETVNSIPAATAAPFKRLGTLADQGGGVWRYTFSNPIDASWKTGSVGVGIQGYVNNTIKGAYGVDTVVRDSNINSVIYASLDAKAPVERRVIVDRNKCNSCHKDLGSPAGLSLHGGSRRNPQYCVQCHNPSLNDAPRHPAGSPPESLQWKYLIHSIHMGSDRAAQINLNGPINTVDIRFPGNQADCQKCHNPGTYTLPLPATVAPAGPVNTVTGQPVNNGVVVNGTAQAISLACAGCHAGKPGFEAHAVTNTSATLGEACANCHGAGKQFDVVTVHAKFLSH